ncbi:MAG: hypothetical protein KDB27_15720 [Planctomycetales bacterium]|nr:hypothetical protein [Planctomycetales bacterium]
MPDSKDFGQGVNDFFDSIKSEAESVSTMIPAVVTPTKQKPSPPKANPKPKQSVEELDRPKARAGRMPGRKNSKNNEPMEKITGRISVALKDEYVEWSLDDRVPLNDLVERALIEFHQRYRLQEQNASEHT